MGSVHWSGVESLSSKYRMALSRWPLPCFAAVSSAEPRVFGVGWDARRDGRERSLLEEELNVWENQPDMRCGKSPPIRLLDGEEG